MQVCRSVISIVTKMQLSSKQVIFIVIHFVLLSISDANKNADQQCSTASTCGECIRLPICIWCANVDTNDDVKTHCMPVDSHTCPTDLLDANPIPEYNVLDRSTRRSIDQLKPDGASLKNIRIGQPFNISINYTVAQNYPVDLYYLMDVSHSMLYHKNFLAIVAGSLVNAMKNLTNDFRLGFGSFVDKNAIPFIHKPYHPNDCVASQPHTCYETYLFKHRQSLTENVDDFARKVNSTPIVQTYDDPEGGLEAFVQAIVCKEHIGWREQARRLVAFATDANSHLAGNGRLAGIVHPNDGLCHLDSSGSYSKELEQDYPSLGQVSRIAKEHAINTIFAVTEDVAATYAAFSKLIPFADVGIVREDATNLVDVIFNKYKEMASRVEMKDTATRGIKTRYFSKCKQNVMQETNKCENLNILDTVEFIVSIEATECPSTSDSVQKVLIFPAGINEDFEIDVEVACDCSCETSGSSGFELDSPTCNNGGNLTCGVCQCDNLHSGRFCECEGNTDHLDLEASCKQSSDSDVLCSGRGQCVCGKCKCESTSNPSEVISGAYCECDNFSCPRLNGNVCSNNGRCVCGTCSCDSGWGGLACDCRASNDSCISGGNGELCSGNGFCNCGVCECKPEASGTFCQTCPTCPSRCDEYTPCVQCKVFMTGPFMDGNQCNASCNYPIVVQPSVQAQESWERECRFKNESDCEFVFVYGEHPDTGLASVRVQELGVCPGPVPLLAIGLGLFLAVALAGIVLLLFSRFMVYMYDRREYARFLEETKNWEMSAETNPLYKGAATTYRNPAYGVKKDG